MAAIKPTPQKKKHSCVFRVFTRFCLVFFARALARCHLGVPHSAHTRLEGFQGGSCVCQGVRVAMRAWRCASELKEATKRQRSGSQGSQMSLSATLCGSMLRLRYAFDCFGFVTRSPPLPAAFLAARHGLWRVVGADGWQCNANHAHLRFHCDRLTHGSLHSQRWDLSMLFHCRKQDWPVAQLEGQTLATTVLQTLDAVIAASAALSDAALCVTILAALVGVRAPLFNRRFLSHSSH